MNHKRRFNDGILNSLTYMSSIITVSILFVVFGFIVSRGVSTLSVDMLRNDYWSQNILVDVNAGCGEFVEPESYSGYFSSCYGIALDDDLSSARTSLVVLSYIDPESPFAFSTFKTAGHDFGKVVGINLGDQIERIETTKASLGMIMNQDSKEVIDNLNDPSLTVLSLYYKTPGGGIWGSLISTLMLILFTLMIALPIGIGAAVYIEEIAKNNRFNKMLAGGIEMLAGIPSIIFGLMGIVVLFPITAFFGVSGLSIILGALTLSIMLFPIIIRSVQEALINVPHSYRMASLSLGANQTQTIFKVILPSALPGIIASVLLSMSRIIGESAALIYTMGTFINDSPKLSQGATTLAVHIWSIMGSEQPNFELAAAISIIILLMVLFLNISLKLLTHMYQKKLKGF